MKLTLAKGKATSCSVSNSLPTRDDFCRLLKPLQMSGLIWIQTV